MVEWVEKERQRKDKTDGAAASAALLAPGADLPKSGALRALEFAAAQEKDRRKSLKTPNSNLLGHPLVEVIDGPMAKRVRRQGSEITVLIAVMEKKLLSRPMWEIVSRLLKYDLRRRHRYRRPWHCLPRPPTRRPAPARAPGTRHWTFAC